MNTLKKILGILGKWIGILLLAILCLLVIVILLIRTPWAQEKIVSYATSYATDKIGTTVNIDRLFITFSGNVQLEGLYVEGQSRDTLLYSNSLEAGVGIRSIFSEELRISGVDWEGLRANVVRRKDSTFNFTYIIDAFAGNGGDTATAQPPQDTASSSIGISVGPINLKDFDITYLDSLSGIDASLWLGALSVTTDELDLQGGRFDLDEIKLTDTRARAIQFLQPPPSEDEDTSASPPPFISWDKISLQNIELYYATQPDTLEADVQLGTFNIANSELALAEENFSVENLNLLETSIKFHSESTTGRLEADAEINSFSIQNSQLNLTEQTVDVSTIKLLESMVELRLPAPTDPSASTSETDTATAKAFAWPDWQVELGQLLLAQNDIQVNIGDQPAPKNVFDPQNIGLQNLGLNLKNVQLADQTASFDLDSLHFEERSGFLINDLSVNAKLTDQQLTVNQLHLNTNNTNLSTSLEVGYGNLQRLMANPMEEAEINLQIDESTRLSVRDAFYFNDSLRYDTLMQNLAGSPIELEGRIQGTSEHLELDQFKASGLQNARLLVDGHLYNLQEDPNNIRVNLSTLSANITDDDIALLTDTTGSGINYPEYVRLNASLNGDMQEILVDLEVNVPDGGIKLKDTRLADLMGIPKYKGLLDVNNIDVGSITGNPDLEPVSLTVNFDGKGAEFSTLALKADFDFQKLNYNDYDYSQLQLTASVENQQASLYLGHTDQNLDFDLDVEALLDSANMMADLNLNLRGADLSDLNLYAQEMKVAMELDAHYEGTPDDFEANLEWNKGIFIKEDVSYRLDSFDIAVDSDNSETDLRIASEIIEGKLTGNTSFTKLLSAVQSYLGTSLSADTAVDSTNYSDLQMHGQFAIAGSPMLTEVFLPQLSRMDSIKIELDFKPANNNLELNVNAPEIIYGESELQQLMLDLNAGSDTLRVDLGFAHLLSGPVEMHQTNLNIDVTDNNGSAELKILNQQEDPVYNILVNIVRQGEYPMLSIRPDQLTLNGKQWQIDPENEVVLRDDYANFNNFLLSREQQQLEITTDRQAHETLIDFNNFNVAAIFSMLNAQESPLAGSLNGNVRLLDLLQNPAFVADITLENLAALGNEVGTLKLTANNREADQYVVDMSLQGQYIDLAADGSYSTANQTNEVNLDLDINELKLALVENFIPNELANVQGGISGHFDIDGPTSDLQYQGNLQFNKASFEPVMLGSQFTINNSRIEVDNNAIRFPNFTITDAYNHELVINGNVGTENMMNPSLDLSVNGQNFRVLNSTREDNDLFWGDAVVGLKIDIGGDMDLPQIDARVKIAEGTDVTYAVPATAAQIEDREGLVRFRDLKDTLNVLSADEDQEAKLSTSMALSAFLQVSPKARFTVIVDPRSNDRLTIAGEADLNLDLNPNGNTNLSGAFEVTDGSYKLRLYELISKEFKLQQGSRIVWRGDPTDALLNLTAIYETEASAVDLMAQQLTGADQSTINRYKEDLPFLVLLNINGTIDQPEISFGLNMPDDAKDALGGNVYARIQQLEQDESELNKQVFSLIVFNRFLPSGVGGSGGGGGTSAIARSSVSNLLSNQLNKLSDKYVGGVELNFDVDSYTDYSTGTAQQQTDLNISLRKSFLDDRVVIEVGSQVGLEGQERGEANNNIIGDVSVEYLLTEDGRYRARAFRRNQYQDILEGQVIIMGLGILFNREFDTFEELMQGAEDEEEENGGGDGSNESGNENGTKEEEENDSDN